MAVEFKYEDWDSDKDILVPRPHFSVGLAMIRSAVRVTRTLTRKQDKVRTSGKALADVVNLMGGCIEWARYYGLTAKELENAVNASIREHKEAKRSKLLTSVQRFRRFSDINAPEKGLKETRNLPR